MTYDGFISYSHAADGRLAPALQQGLQRLAKPWNSRRALRIFRDETGLSTNPHLWSSIEQALDDSEWFVLLASPESARSEWVGKEIAHWLEVSSIDRILPVVTDGTWEWDPASGDFTPESSAVPEALRGVLAAEPRHLDLCWARDETDLDLRNSRFRSAIADLAAPMHGVAKDELEGEDIRQHRRARRLARGGVAALGLLVVISVVVSLFAVVQRNSARTATRAAQQELLIADSQAQIATNRPLATLLAIEAVRRDPSAEARDALLNSILAEPSLQRSFATGQIWDLAPLVGHRVVVLKLSNVPTPNSASLQVWNWQTGLRQSWPSAPSGDSSSRPLDASASPDGTLLAVLSGRGMIQLYSGRTLEPQGPAFPSGLDQFPGDQGRIGWSPDGHTIAVYDNDETATAPYDGRSISLLSHVQGRWIADPPPLGVATRAAWIAFSSDGSVLAIASPTPAGSNIVVDDVATGRTLVSFGAVAASSIDIDWARRRVVVGDRSGNSGDAVWYDLNTPVPTAHAIDVGSSQGTGFAVVGYDPTTTRLVVDTQTELGIFDATTFAPLADDPVLPTLGGVGPFVFLDPDHVLTAPVGVGPVELWDLSGTSVLATHAPAQFSAGVAPIGRSTFVGISTLNDTDTLLGADDRPVSAPIPGPTMCRDARSGRFATVVSSTGDVVIRDGSPPFAVLSRAPGVAAGLGSAFLCAWSPDGRTIAISLAPRSPLPASVALYDVDQRTVTFVKSFSGTLDLLSMYFSPDSKTLWVGGPDVNGSPGIYRLTDLDHGPRLSIAFPGATAISGSADGRRLVVTYPEGVRLFDGHTFRPVAGFVALPTSTIYGVASIRDGSGAVVQGLAGWRLIDLAAQRPIGPWIPDGNGSLIFPDSDGSRIYVVDADGEHDAVWDLSPSNLRAAACGLAGRNLTAQEWQKYLSWAGPPRSTCPQNPTA